MTTRRASWAVAGTAVAVGLIATSFMFVPPYPIPAWVIAGIPSNWLDSWWYSSAEPHPSRLYDQLSMIGGVFYPLLVAVVFWFWCRPLRRSDRWFPRRTQVVGLIGLVVSALWYAFGWAGGIKYQGVKTLALYVIVNVVSFGALVLLWRAVKRRNSWWGSLAAHADGHPGHGRAAT